MHTLRFNPQQPLPPLWLGLWVPLLAIGWLVPNHYHPWATFHTEVWVSAMIALAVAVVIVRPTSSVKWHGLPLVIALLATLPFLQYAAGMLPFSGLAWVCTAYVLGLLLALLAGARWEAASPGCAADGLFLAIGIAAAVSVGLQLRQWLGLGSDDLQIWTGEFTPGRPSANLAQPNQLATLLLWGLMACAWGVVRQKIRSAFAVAMTLCVLFGVVLTQSRIAFVAMLVITLAAWGWRGLWASRAVPWVVSFLFLYFVICTFFLRYLSDQLGLGLQIRSVSLGGTSTHLRFQAYSLFIDAIGHRPWWGYGWYQLPVAQLSVAQNHANLASFFTHSHNLFLDLVLWCGLPIGGLVSIFLIGWFLRCIRKVKNKEDAVLALFLLVVGLHAMVELPLHHAYFLLPTGLVMGMLNQRQKSQVIFSTNRWVLLSLWLGVSILLGTIIRDYLRVDESFRTYQLEAAHIGNLPPGEPPDVLLLNDLRAYIKNARTDVHPNISVAELEQLRTITYSFPTTVNLFNVAKALAFRHEPAEAYAWMQKIQKVQPDGYAQDLARIWESQSRTQPAMAAVKWPPPESKAAEPAVPKPSSKIN